MRFGISSKLKKAAMPLFLSLSYIVNCRHCRGLKLAYPDATQFDSKSKYFDPKATSQTPRWFNVDVKFVKKTRVVGIKELRDYPALANLRILQKGNRLSITPVDPAEWKFISGIL